MAKDLTTSAIERQNVLNNNLAIPRIQEALVGTGDCPPSHRHSFRSRGENKFVIHLKKKIHEKLSTGGEILLHLTFHVSQTHSIYY